MNAELERVQTDSVMVPLERPVRTTCGREDDEAGAELVLIDLVTSDGAIGYAYLLSYYHVGSPPPLEQLVLTDTLRREEVDAARFRQPGRDGHLRARHRRVGHARPNYRAALVRLAEYPSLFRPTTASECSLPVKPLTPPRRGWSGDCGH